MSNLRFFQDSSYDHDAQKKPAMRKLRQQPKHKFHSCTLRFSISPFFFGSAGWMAGSLLLAAHRVLLALVAKGAALLNRYL